MGETQLGRMQFRIMQVLVGPRPGECPGDHRRAERVGAGGSQHGADAAAAARGQGGGRSRGGGAHLRLLSQAQGRQGQADRRARPAGAGLRRQRRQPGRPPAQERAALQVGARRTSAADRPTSARTDRRAERGIAMWHGSCGGDAGPGRIRPDLAGAVVGLAGPGPAGRPVARSGQARRSSRASTGRRSRPCWFARSPRRSWPRRASTGCRSGSRLAPARPQVAAAPIGASARRSGSARDGGRVGWQSLTDARATPDQRRDRRRRPDSRRSPTSHSSSTAAARVSFPFGTVGRGTARPGGLAARLGGPGRCGCWVGQRRMAQAAGVGGRRPSRKREALCRDLAGRMRVTPPDVLRSPFLFSPCLDGLRRPAILLPDDVGENLRETFVHELAHLARHDGLWNLLRRWPRRRSGSSRCSGCSRAGSRRRPRRSATTTWSSLAPIEPVMPGICSSSPAGRCRRSPRRAWAWSRCDRCSPGGSSGSSTRRGGSRPGGRAGRRRHAGRRDSRGRSSRGCSASVGKREAEGSKPIRRSRRGRSEA